MDKKFMDVKMSILEEIKKMPPNTKLPSERVFVDVFQFSRPTIQKALTELEHEGVIYRIPRQGSFTSDHKLHKSLTKLESFTNELMSSGDSPSTKLLSFEIVPADEIIASKLKIPIGSEVYNFVRLRLKNGVPIILDNSYFSSFAVENITCDVLIKSIYEFIETVKKLKIHMSHQIIDAVLPDEFVYRNLNLPQNQPVVLIDMVCYLSDGRAFEYSISYKNPKKYLLEMNSYR